MRALLDVNVVIALLDPDHVFHGRAHNWWAANQKLGWASSPITENGVVRILSSPNYKKGTPFTPGDVISQLTQFAQNSNHAFWPDDVSLRDKDAFSIDRIHSSRILTDLYLLALAIKHGGRLVTFDQGIPLTAVCGTKLENLCVA